MAIDEYRPNPFQEAKTIQVEVAFATPEHQRIMSVDVPLKTTAERAVELSKIVEVFPEIDLNSHPIGIFGKKIPLDTLLKAGDRVEIYRPLKADPKEVRRALAALGKTMGKKK